MKLHCFLPELALVIFVCNPLKHFPLLKVKAYKNSKWKNSILIKTSSVQGIRNSAFNWTVLSKILGNKYFRGLSDSMKNILKTVSFQNHNYRSSTF